LCLCALQDLIDTIGKKWNLLILEEISKQEKLRYSDLLVRFEGISPSTLASSLKKLENKGLVNRKLFKEIPPRTEYSITKKGKNFFHALKPLHEWIEINKNPEFGCDCKQKTSRITRFQNKAMNRMIEASMCACTCMPMMAGIFILENPIL
jgi:DNA-binding HxlR family transcriptional regulator